MRRNKVPVSRRNLLKAGVAAGAATVFSGWIPRRVYAGGGTLDPTSLEQFVDPLPIPGVVQPVTSSRYAARYNISMSEFQQKLHRDLDPTTVWGYNGTFPGPTIEARVGKKVIVKLSNDLPTTHLLPVDKTIHGATGDYAEVRTALHLHGGRTLAPFDGYPEDTFEPGKKKAYLYKNEQEATTLWYHDHALGITRLNVYAGMAAFYLLRDDHEDSLGLPSGDYEIPIVIQDRCFNSDGSLFYPTVADPPPEPGYESLPPGNPSIVAEFFGDTIVVNGAVWPRLDVEPRKYRFRLLNGSGSRFYILEFPLGSAVRFLQVGGDGGLLPNAVPTRRLVLGPAERADVVVDFARSHWNRVILKNRGPDEPYKGRPQPPADPNTTGQIMLFNLVASTGPDESQVPASLNTIVPLTPDQPERVVTLEEGLDEFGRLKLLLDGRTWVDPITENIKLNATEQWTIANFTEDVHPIHLHLVQFQILNRARVTGWDPATREIQTGPPIPPAANESGWKDTVLVNPGQVARIVAKFDLPGTYVWHCHILEHEDHEMMRPMIVGPPPKG